VKQVEAAGVTIIRPDKKLFSARVVAMKRAYEGTAVGQVIQRIEAVTSASD